MESLPERKGREKLRGGRSPEAPGPDAPSPLGASTTRRRAGSEAPPRPPCGAQGWPHLLYWPSFWAPKANHSTIKDYFLMTVARDKG